jgi:hypothetical protein
MTIVVAFMFLNPVHVNARSLAMEAARRQALRDLGYETDPQLEYQNEVQRRRSELMQQYHPEIYDGEQDYIRKYQRGDEINLIPDSSYGNQNRNMNRPQTIKDGKNVTINYTDGKFIGEVHNGKPDGQGTLIFNNGDKYIGEFKQGQREGKGTHIHHDGHNYIGEFNDGQFEGQGNLTYADGSKYIGEFKKGKREGQGTYTSASGEILTGKWRDHYFVGSSPASVNQNDSPKEDSVLNSIKTKYGVLEIKDIGENEKGLYQGATLIDKMQGYLEIEKVFHTKNSEIVLLSSNVGGGSGTVTYNFFVNLTANSPPTMSEEFEPESEPIQNGEIINVDLGYIEGIRQILTYQDGKTTIQKLALEDKNKPEKEGDCKFLYDDLYLAYVNNRACDDAPEEASSMYALRQYVSLSKDPHLNMKTFQSLSKESCKKASTIKCPKFKELVCAG